MLRRLSTDESCPGPHGGTYVPVCIAEGNEAELSGRIDDQVLGHSTEMGHGQASPHHELNDEVSVAHAVQAVFCDRLEAQLLCQELTVHSERIARERSGAQGKDGYAGNKLLQPFKICPK